MQDSRTSVQMMKIFMLRHEKTFSSCSMKKVFRETFNSTKQKESINKIDERKTLKQQEDIVKIERLSTTFQNLEKNHESASRKFTDELEQVLESDFSKEKKISTLKREDVTVQDHAKYS